MGKMLSRPDTAKQVKGRNAYRYTPEFWLPVA